jgi:hypothetical protein
LRAWAALSACAGWEGEGEREAEGEGDGQKERKRVSGRRRWRTAAGWKL